MYTETNNGEIPMTEKYVRARIYRKESRNSNK